jgi:hypothetical protein
MSVDDRRLTSDSEPSEPTADTSADDRRLTSDSESSEPSADTSADRKLGKMD